VSDPGRDRAAAEALQGAARRLGDEGARRFARWDAALYRDLYGGPGARLWKRIQGKPGSEAVLEAYLALAVEAIGLGYVDRAGFDATTGDTRSAPNLIALLWIVKIPGKGLDGAAEAMLARLAKAWNLGEGLLGQPAWLNRYVAGALHAPMALDDLEARLAEILEPALVVRAPSSLRGPFTVTTIDAVEVDDLFLPGEMHLAAPAVLCVHDRKRANASVGVFLRAQAASSFLPPGPCLGEGPRDEGAPACELLVDAVRIGRARVALPFVAHGHRAIVARAGFVVVSAVDSQRLWVVESP
jgi:hypothetical protein